MVADSTSNSSSSGGSSTSGGNTGTVVDPLTIAVIISIALNSISITLLLLDMLQKVVHSRWLSLISRFFSGVSCLSPLFPPLVQNELLLFQNTPAGGSPSSNRYQGLLRIASITWLCVLVFYFPVLVACEWRKEWRKRYVIHILSPLQVFPSSSLSSSSSTGYLFYFFSFTLSQQASICAYFLYSCILIYRLQLIKN